MKYRRAARGTRTVGGFTNSRVTSAVISCDRDKLCLQRRGLVCVRVRVIRSDRSFAEFTSQIIASVYVRRALAVNE